MNEQVGKINIIILILRYLVTRVTNIGVEPRTWDFAAQSALPLSHASPAPVLRYYSILFNRLILNFPFFFC